MRQAMPRSSVPSVGWKSQRDPFSGTDDAVVAPLLHSVTSGHLRLRGNFDPLPTRTRRGSNCHTRDALHHHITIPPCTFFLSVFARQHGAANDHLHQRAEKNDGLFLRPKSAARARSCDAISGISLSSPPSAYFRRVSACPPTSAQTPLPSPLFLLDPPLPCVRTDVRLFLHVRLGHGQAPRV